MGCSLPADHPIFRSGPKNKAGKGDLGEAICASILEDYGLEVKNLNQAVRNAPGIDLIFNNKKDRYPALGASGAVQCRGGIRNQHKSRLYNRPECDGSKIDNPKIKRAEEQARTINADLYFSIAYLYPRDEDETVLFFFLATNDFMRRYCSESYGYRFWTHRIFDMFMPVEGRPSTQTGKGLLFRMYMFNTRDILDLMDSAESLNLDATISLLKNTTKKHLARWRSWREFDGVFSG